jgi:hypothetical protein
MQFFWVDAGEAVVDRDGGIRENFSVSCEVKRFGGIEARDGTGVAKVADRSSHLYMFVRHVAILREACPSFNPPFEGRGKTLSPVVFLHATGI